MRPAYRYETKSFMGRREGIPGTGECEVGERGWKNNVICFDRGI